MKVLVVLNQGIGNIIMATPMLKAIKSLGHNIDLYLIPNFKGVKGLFENWKIIDMVWENPEPLLILPGQYDRIVFGAWCDESIINHPLFGGKTKIFLPYKDWKIKHEIEWNMDLARMLGYIGETPPLMINTKKHKPKDDYYRIGFHTGCLSKFGWDKKRWPYFEQLLSRLIERYKNDKVYIYLYGTEEDNTPHIPSKMIINEIGIDLKQTAKSMSYLDLFISNDSGLMHLAAALDIPLIALFGPTLTVKNAPICSKVEIISGSLPCQPCLYTPLFQSCTLNQCMYEISVTKILGVIEKWKM